MTQAFSSLDLVIVTLGRVFKFSLARGSSVVNGLVTKGVCFALLAGELVDGAIDEEAAEGQEDCNEHHGSTSLLSGVQSFTVRDLVLKLGQFFLLLFGDSLVIYLFKEFRDSAGLPEGQVLLVFSVVGSAVGVVNLTFPLDLLLVVSDLFGVVDSFEGHA